MTDALLTELWQSRLPLVWSTPGGQLQLESPGLPAGILSGSFNPLHSGHIALREAAELHLNGPVFYELPIRNADKPPLDFDAIEQRRRQFREHPLALTNAPTFAEKARLFPGSAFVVGVDTAERIIQPRFYGGEVPMHAALEEIRAAGCRFLVAGRTIGGEFRTLADLELPCETEALFEELPALRFRFDVSSTEIRGRIAD